MSVEEVRKAISSVQSAMTDRRSYYYEDNDQVVSSYYLATISSLTRSYGQYIGKGKAANPTYIDEINKLDEKITEYLELFVKSKRTDYCFKLTNLLINKISEILFFIENLDNIPIKEMVLKSDYKELLLEKKGIEIALEHMSKYRGDPKLEDLLLKTRSIGIPLDEHWVLSLCSVNLMEALVNRKLDQLGVDSGGSFKQKINRLSDEIKKRENRDISNLVPRALYDGIRNKLDHASDKNIITYQEALHISDIVMQLLDELFS